MTTLLSSRLERRHSAAGKRIDCRRLTRSDDERLAQSARGATVESGRAHQHGSTVRPGMLTAGEMRPSRTRKARTSIGWFLEFMIKHHEVRWSWRRPIETAARASNRMSSPLPLR